MSACLLIEPSAAHRSLLEKLIGETGSFSRVIVGDNHKDALPQVGDSPVDMICYGVEHLCQCDCLWLENLRKNREWADVPVIIFSAVECETERILGLEAGANDCLSYLVSAKEAAVRIRRHLANKRRIDQLRQISFDLAQAASTDPLTGLGNRRHFNTLLNSEYARCKRQKKPLSLLLLDLDFFKHVNDTYGHQAGDEVLVAVSRAIKDSVRQYDSVARLGGEEFAVILPQTGNATAFVVAERIRKCIASLHCRGPQKLQAAVTVSIGIAALDIAPGLNQQQLIEEADRALYRAKSKGRNRTEKHAPSTLFNLADYLGDGPCIALAH